MRIVIDLQAAQTASSRTRGIGRQALALAQAMARRRGPHEVLLALSNFDPASIDPVRAAFEGLLPPEAIRIWYGAGTILARAPKVGVRSQAAEIIYEAFLASLQPDVVHIPSLFEGSGGDGVTSIGRFCRHVPTVVTLHDLIPLIDPGRYLVDAAHRAWYYRKLEDLGRAELLLAVSESTRQEAIGHLGTPPERVVTISSGVDPRFRRLLPDEEGQRALLARHGLTRPVVMYTGGGDHRKNVAGLIRGFAGLPLSLRRQHQLAIVCQIAKPELKILGDLVAQLGLMPDEVVLTGFVADEDLIGLYNACKLFVFPSLHEGFGLPILEAMRCGAPVIGANRTSLPEVIGREDALFAPEDEASLAALMGRALGDEAFRADLAAYGLRRAELFSWDICADRALRAMEQLHAGRGHEQPGGNTLLPDAIRAIAALDPLFIRRAHKTFARALAHNHPDDAGC